MATTSRGPEIILRLRGSVQDARHLFAGNHVSIFPQLHGSDESHPRRPPRIEQTVLVFEPDGPPGATEQL